jgi:VanZ family protein
MHQIKLWGPVIVWAAVIFAFSSVPSLSSGLGTWDEVLRKGAHITEYAILGALLFRALGRELPALLVGIVYAATDEVHQHFVSGRHSSPFDVAFDACGLALGLLVALSIQSNRARTKELRRPPARRDPRAAGRAP